MKSLLIFLSFAIVANVARRRGSYRGSTPTLLEIALEGISDLQGGPSDDREWKTYLPQDIDKDNDGQLSDKEVEVSFKEYMKDIFDTLDHYSDIFDEISEDEFRSAGLDLNLVNKIIDVAFKSYPIIHLDEERPRERDGLIDSSNDVFPSRCPQRFFLQDVLRGLCEVWNVVVAYISFEDGYGNQKVKMETLKSEVKEVLAVMFPLLDQNDDELISANDITTINVKLPEVLDLAKKLFDVIDQKTGGDGEIDLANDIFKNSDGILNMKDYQSFAKEHIDRNSWFPQAIGLLGILSRNLDITQDDKISMAELKPYVEDVFKNLDADDDRFITLDDFYKLMQKTQFTCLQIEEVQAFVERWKEFVETGVDNLLTHFFNKFDQNSDGFIPLEEFYEAKVPCGIQSPCEVLFEGFFFPNGFDRDIPQISTHLVVDWYWSTSKTGFSLEEKLANAACMVMQHPL